MICDFLTLASLVTGAVVIKDAVRHQVFDARLAVLSLFLVLTSIAISLGLMMSRVP